MTTPKIIGHLTGCSELNRRDQRELAKYASFEGGIDSMPMRKDDPIRDALKHALKPAGYRVMLDNSRCHPYDPWCYVTGMGSAFYHNDTGMGLQAAVLVAALPLTRGGYCDSSCQFTSRGQWLDCQVGTVFVFNGDHDHAWIANCRWCLATHSIRRTRNRHTTQRRTAEQRA
tara:strand:+ start:4786 stop:5301 length:516 start_codon:yes stop_codon:yes gene_type:complete